MHDIDKSFGCIEVKIPNMTTLKVDFDVKEYNSP